MGPLNWDARPTSAGASSRHLLLLLLLRLESLAGWEREHIDTKALSRVQFTVCKHHYWMRPDLINTQCPPLPYWKHPRGKDQSSSFLFFCFHQTLIHLPTCSGKRHPAGYPRAGGSQWWASSQPPHPFCPSWMTQPVRGRGVWVVFSCGWLPTWNASSVAMKKKKSINPESAQNCTRQSEMENLKLRCQ